MKKCLLVLFVSLLACLNVLAQHTPPKVILIVREEIKPGMMPIHSRHAAEYAAMFAKLQTPNGRIALVPIAGNENEVIYLNAAESFAEIEKINQDTDKKMSAVNASMQSQVDRLNKEAPALHNAMRDMLAVYRPDLSFNPGANIPQMRYFSVTTVRIRPGRDAQYADYVQKVASVAREKAKIDNVHLAVYQIVSGAPGGTYLVFRPMKSLSEMDEPSGMKVRAAMGDDMRKDADKMYGEAVMSSETSTYAFAPRMSFVSKEFASAAPDFWHPRMETAAKPKPKKRAPKAPPTPPAN
ncbi:MAG TPA: hypothetical protein VFH15_10455 [Pyrinomonadaceae bacterium]|nr:hypothetical protein [Pyrinomonadaceae bacterium]